MLNLSQELSAGLDSATMFPARTAPQEAAVDMTAMIDLVFMLNIFFMVTTLVTALAEIDLPTASHVVAADLDNSFVLTVLVGVPGQPPRVYVGTSVEGDPLPSDSQSEAIAAAAEKARAEGCKSIVIKAEKAVLMSDIGRISAAAAEGGEMALHLGVREGE